MQFCGLTIITDKKFAQEIATAQKIQRNMNNKLTARLLFNAEHYRIAPNAILRREPKLPKTKVKARR